jgi:hypothetical protein
MTNTVMQRSHNNPATPWAGVVYTLQGNLHTREGRDLFAPNRVYWVCDVPHRQQINQTKPHNSSTCGESNQKHWRPLVDFQPCVWVAQPFPKTHVEQIGLLGQNWEFGAATAATTSVAAMGMTTFGENLKAAVALFREMAVPSNAMVIATGTCRKMSQRHCLSGDDGTTCTAILQQR